MYSSNRFVPRISLKNNNKSIGQLLFYPKESVLPADNIVNDQITLHYDLEDYPNIIDLLRNESSLYLVYRGSGAEFENGIKTAQEVSPL